MVSDIAKGQGSEESIAQGMDNGIGIGVALETPGMGNTDPSEYQIPTFTKRVNIHPLPYTQHHSIPSLRAIEIVSNSGTSRRKGLPAG